MNFCTKSRLFYYFLIFIILACLTSKVSAQPAGWSTSMPFTVIEKSGSLLTDYQILLTVNTQFFISGGNMQPDGRDIRFTLDAAGTQMLNYWIESGINTDSTRIWVLVDSIPANGTRQAYFVCGNPGASAASTISIFSGPNSSIDSLTIGSNGGVTNSQRGFRFAPTEDLLVTDFGKREPTGSTRYITMFDFNSHAILYQTQVSGPAAQYSYTAIPNPYWITSGTEYLIEIYQGNSDGYYFGAPPQVGQHLILFDMRYCNTCSQNTFPTNFLTGQQYGFPDFLYYLRKHASVEPTIDGSPLLPVELAYFTASAANEEVRLEWKTATEVNNYGFEVEKRSQKPGVGSQEESSTWQNIGFVKGSGNSNSQKQYSFIDNDVKEGKYQYRLKQVDNDGKFEYSKTVEASFIKPDKFALEQNYPNPFNPETNFEFRISDFGLVTLKIYDILGNEVTTLVNEEKEPGIYSVEFNGSSLSSGVYYYTLRAGQFTQTKKLLLMK